MKNTMKKFACFAFAAMAASAFFGSCGEESPEKSELETFSLAAGKVAFEDMGAYEGDVNEGANSNQHAVENGIIISPYLTCRVNGKEVPVYATRCTSGAHSFAYADVTGNGEIYLDVELTLVKTRNKAVVLPENKNVKAELDKSKKNVKAVIRETGNFSFAFDDKEERGFTLIVKRAQKEEFPENYRVKYFDPGGYSAAQTAFTEENTVYYFRSGSYEIDGISLPSNSILYADYAYFKVNNETAQAALNSHNTENVKVLGKSVYDFTGIDMIADSKGTFSYNNVDDFEFRGVTSIGSCGWTFCFTGCNNGKISDILGLAYRTYTDGIMVANSNHMRISDCFMRTGDDAFEVKSTGNGEAEDIIFEDCHAWNDKAVGFGVIYEMRYAVRGVTFRNCSVGFNMPTWDETRAAASVCMDDYEQRLTNRDITFENFEVYYSMCPAISICLHTGSIDNVRFKNFNVKKNFAEYPVFLKFTKTYIGRPLTEKRYCSIDNLYFDDITIEGNRLTFGNIRNIDYPSNQYEKIKDVYLDGVKYEGNQ